MDEVLEILQRKFAGDMKLGGVAAVLPFSRISELLL